MSKLNMEHFERLFMTGQLDGNTDEGGKGDGEGDATATIEKLKAENEKLRGEKESILKNKDEILAEKKKQDQAKREAEEANLKLAAEKALKDKDFETYKKSHDEILKTQADNFASERAVFNKAQSDAEAVKIASRISEGVNVELMTQFIAPRIRFDGGSLEVLDEAGKVSAVSLKDLESEFTNSAKYASLIKGNKSSGGGANGGSGGAGGEAKKITRSELEALTPIQQAAHFKSGGIAIDD